MPILGTNYNSEDPSGSYTVPNIRIDGLQPTNNNAVANTGQVFALVPDATLFQGTGGFPAGTSLRDLTEGQDWLLQRVVGRFHLMCRGSGGPPDDWDSVLVAAGLFVARANDVNQGQPDLTTDEYDPLNAQQTREPWLWRRTWMFINSAALGNPAYGVGTTMGMGSVADGGVVDSKVKRRVRREERLFMAINCMGFSPNFTTAVENAQELQPVISGVFDYRIFGAMRRSNNRSTF